jgi:hypothetical protein
MAPPTQDGEKELPSRVEAIRPCSCAYTTLSHQWGRRFTHALTHERVCGEDTACGWVRVKVCMRSRWLLFICS